MVANAAKFSPAGATVRVRATVSPAGAFEIAVSDEGPGIPPSAIERVTLPFFQADDSLSRSHEGSGLGLYLAKSFLELHGGGLEIASPRVGGTVAALKLPPSRVHQTQRVNDRG
ncbi:MAG: ATP-binding protein [Rhodovibrio sp.]|nr:ATP-binding protein [Rhodovibrio sp.]